MDEDETAPIRTTDDEEDDDDDRRPTLLLDSSAAAAANGTLDGLCKAAMAEINSRLAATNAKDDDGNNNHVDSGVSDLEDGGGSAAAAPLNLTVKKRRTAAAAAAAAADGTTNNTSTLVRAKSQRSAFETVATATTNSTVKPNTLTSALTMALAAGPSPYVLNRLLPYSLFAGSGGAANHSTNGGGGAPTVDAMLNDAQGAGALAAAFGSPYLAMTPPPPAQGKQQRPFKAYNPMDPMSALQINGLGLSPALRNGDGAHKATAQYLTDQLLQPYRQYLLQQQQQQQQPTANGSATKQLLAAAIKQQQLAGGHTPSPPEVSSTSHPHTEHQQQQQGQKPQQALNGRCVLSPSPSSSETGASSGGMNSSTSPVTSEEMMLDRVHHHSPSTAASAVAHLHQPQLDGHEGVRKKNGIATAIGSAVATTGGGQGTNGRRKGRVLPETLKDDAYWERRRKNNEAAKRSRDARRAKEDEIAVRAALLEQENMRLRIEVAALKAETEKLRQMLLKG